MKPAAPVTSTFKVPPFRVKKGSVPSSFGGEEGPPRSSSPILGDPLRHGHPAARGAAADDMHLPCLQPSVDLILRQHGLDVVDEVIRRPEAPDAGRAELDELAVRNR